MLFCHSFAHVYFVRRDNGINSLSARYPLNDSIAIQMDVEPVWHVLHSVSASGYNNTNLTVVLSKPLHHPPALTDKMLKLRGRTLT